MHLWLVFLYFVPVSLFIRLLIYFRHELPTNPAFITWAAALHSSIQHWVSDFSGIGCHGQLYLFINVKILHHSDLLSVNIKELKSTDKGKILLYKVLIVIYDFFFFFFFLSTSLSVFKASLHVRAVWYDNIVSMI